MCHFYTLFIFIKLRKNGTPFLKECVKCELGYCDFNFSLTFKRNQNFIVNVSNLNHVKSNHIFLVSYENKNEFLSFWFLESIFDLEIILKIFFFILMSYFTLFDKFKQLL